MKRLAFVMFLLATGSVIATSDLVVFSDPVANKNMTKAKRFIALQPLALHVDQQIRCPKLGHQ